MHNGRVEAGHLSRSRRCLHSGIQDVFPFPEMLPSCTPAEKLMACCAWSHRCAASIFLLAQVMSWTSDEPSWLEQM